MECPRLPSGIPGLDQVLGGGLPQSGVLLLSGEPGSGKTVMAQQIAYGGATPERPALYFSTVAEPYEKLITHVQPFTFYRRDFPGRAVRYVPLGDDLWDGGLSRALATIKAEVTRLFPGFVIIDSFRAIKDFAANAVDLTQFLYDLAGTLSALRCVTLLIEESPVEDVLKTPVAAVADGILHLHNARNGRSDRRWLQVLKLRGSSFLPGSHLFGIDSNGATVYPRLGSILPDFGYELATGYCPTGVAGLDEALGGGFPRGGAALVIGEPGTGKTVFALSYIVNGALAGEPGVYASLQETPGWLRRTAASFGWDIPSLKDKGLLSMLYEPPLDSEVDRLGHRLLSEVDRLGARRAVIDAVTDLGTAAISDDDFDGFVYALSQVLQRRGVTTLLTAAATPENARWAESHPLARLTDATLRLDLELLPSSCTRRIHLVKVRAAQAKVGVLPMEIVRGLGLAVKRTVPAGEVATASGLDGSRGGRKCSDETPAWTGPGPRPRPRIGEPANTSGQSWEERGLGR